MSIVTFDASKLRSIKAKALAARYTPSNKPRHSARVFTPKTVALKHPEQLSKPSDRRPFKIDYDGHNIYISYPMTVGNSKLSRDVLIFDTLAVYTCGNCSDCANRCYAVKAQKAYPTCWDKRATNTYLAAHNIALLRHLLVLQLATSNKPYVRIHASGEFFSQQYVNMWTDIAMFFPHIQFYYYTKMSDILDFTQLESLPNVNAVKSILPDGSVNFGGYEYVEQKSLQFNIPVCPYGREKAKAKHQAEREGKEKGLTDRKLKRFISRAVKAVKNRAVHCGSDCTVCMHCDHVLFYEH